MPDKRIIHAHEDVARLVRFADAIGLLVLPDRLPENDPTPWTPERLRPFSRGTLLFFRSQWVTNDLQLDASVGIFAGTFSVRASTNLSVIQLSVSGELDVEGVHRLGAGSISFKREWLAEPAHEMRPTPPEVEVVYKQLCKHLLSNVIARGGGFRYHVCNEAAAIARRMETRPPFDYIEWPPPDLHKGTRQKRASK